MKRFLALFLSALMIVTSVPVSSVTSFAAEKTIVAEENIQEIQEDLSENSEEQEDALLEEKDSSEQMQDIIQEETQEDNQEGAQEEQEAPEEVITETTDEEEIVEEAEAEVIEETSEPMLADGETRNIVERGNQNGYTWELDDEGLLTATIDGTVQFGSPWHSLQNQIKRVEIKITNNCTSLNDLFNTYPILESVIFTEVDTSNVTDMGSMFQNCPSLTELDVSDFDTSKVLNMHGMFADCPLLTELDVSGFDTSNVTKMGFMFNKCKSLTSLDVSGFDTSNVNDMSSMFAGCSGLTTLNVSSFDTSNVTMMMGMFSGCSGLTELNVKNFDTSNVTVMSGMFSGCSSLTNLDLRNFKTQNLTEIHSMFRDCSALKELDLSNFDTSKVTYSMDRMFLGCSSLKSLNISSFDTSGVTAMDYMFKGCSSLESLDVSGFKTSNVTDMGYMFAECSALTSLDVSSFDTSNVTNMEFMFEKCSALKELDLSNFDMVNVERDYSMLNGCNARILRATDKYSVTSVAGGYTIGTSSDPTGTKLILKHSYTEPLEFYVKAKPGYSLNSVLYQVGKDKAKELETTEESSKGNKYVIDAKNIKADTVIIVNTTKVEDLSKATIIPEFESLDYTGSAIEAKSIAVSFGTTEVPSDEYIVDYLDDHKSAGTHVLRVSAKPDSKNYSGYKDYSFIIKGGKITDTNAFTIEVDKTVSWEGIDKDTVPNIVIKNKEGAALNKDTDYLVFYSNNSVPGTAKATIVGINGYEGNKTVSYSIPKPSFADPTEKEVAYNLSVSGISNKAYTGTAITQELTVNYYDGNKNAIQLEEGTDYTVKYSKNVKAGTANVVITGKGNYTGKVTKNFIIEPVDLGNLPEGTTVKVTAPGVKFVAGKAVKTTPVVELVKDNQVVATLKTGTDYVKLSDEDFTENTSKTTTAKVTITGKGNYKGTATGTYAIADKNLADKNIRVTYKNEIGSVIYPGKPVEPEVVVQIKGDGDTYTDISTSNYYIQYSENNKPGTATVKIIGTGEYYGTKTLNFKITARKVSEEDIRNKLTIAMDDNPYNEEAIPSYEFTGYAITPEVTIKDKGISDDYELVKGKDYTVSYSSNTNVGKATAKITFKGNYSGSISKSFMIGKLDLSQVSGDSIEIFNQPYNNGKAVTPIPLIKNQDGKPVNPKALKLTYQDNKNVGTATIIIKGAKETNVVGQKEITFEIEKANLSRAVFSKIADQIYTGKTVAPKFTLTYNKVKLKENVDYTVEYSRPEGGYKGEWTVTVKAIENENSKFTGEAISTFIVK